jgi:hypothetical protein
MASTTVELYYHTNLESLQDGYREQIASSGDC